MTKRKWTIVLTILFILVTSYGLMKFLIAQKPELPRKPAGINERWVKAIPVTYAALESPVRARGRVISTAEVDLISEAAGRIEPGDVPLKKGQPFQKGNALFTIYQEEAALALKAQKSRFLNAIANLLPDMQVDYPDQETTFSSFFNNIDIETPLPPLPKTDTEALKIFLASRNILADYYTIQQAELRLARHTVKAPFDGVLSQVYLETGAYTNIGGRVGRMLATRALEVDVPVDNANAYWIKPGNDVILSSSGRKQSWQGVVARVSDFVDELTQSRSVFVKISLAGQPALYAGEYLDAVFNGMAIKEVIEIPRDAMFNFNEVFTVREGLLKIEEVDIVKVNETTVLIRGLKEGIYLVNQPLINVSENTAVKILGVDSADRPKSVLNADKSNPSE